jgi:hypothetical protein
MKQLLAVLIFSTLTALGADVSGKWTGSFVITLDGEQKDDVALLDLKQVDGKITGTAGPNAEKQFPIKAGTIEGNKIRLEVDAHEAPITMELILDGDRITGDAKSEHEGKKMTAKLDLKREK